MIFKYKRDMYNLDRYCAWGPVKVWGPEYCIKLFTKAGTDKGDLLSFKSEQERNFALEDLSRALQEGLNFYDLDQAIDQLREEQE